MQSHLLTSPFHCNQNRPILKHIVWCLHVNINTTKIMMYENGRHTQRPMISILYNSLIEVATLRPFIVQICKKRGNKYILFTLNTTKVAIH